MNRILDYIFYRTYIAYVKGNDPAGFISPSYLSLCLFFFFLPLFTIFGDMVRGDNDLYGNCFWGIYVLGIFLFVFIRYLRKGKISMLIGEYSNCSLNRTIPTWCFFLILPISMVVGVIGIFLVTRYLIDPCGLTGIWYPFFANLFGNQSEDFPNSIILLFPHCLVNSWWWGFCLLSFLVITQFYAYSNLVANPMQIPSEFHVTPISNKSYKRAA